MALKKIDRQALPARPALNSFFTVTMLSLGLPMFLMGDEARRTQHGNNNAYCQDDESNWSLVAKHADVYRFVKLLIARDCRETPAPSAGG